MSTSSTGVNGAEASAGKAMETLQEVKLNDDSDDSDSDGEVEAWNDEGNDEDSSGLAVTGSTPVDSSGVEQQTTASNNPGPISSGSNTPPPPPPPPPVVQQYATIVQIPDPPPLPPSHNHGHLQTNPLNSPKGRHNMAGGGRVKTPVRESNARKQKSNPQQQQHHNPQHRHHHHAKRKQDDDEDVSSRAAVALAAVAAAATANNSSPSAAAQAARAVAQSFVRGAKSNSNDDSQKMPHKPKQITPVKLALVKEQLLFLCMAESEDGTSVEESSPGSSSAATVLYPFVEKLANGHNDSFLKHLLMLEYYRALDDEEDDELAPGVAGLKAPPPSTPTVAVLPPINGEQQTATSPTATGKSSASPKPDEDSDPERQRAECAASAVLSLWKKIEGAYGSMESMLPKTGSSKQQHNSSIKSFEDRLKELPSATSSDDASGTDVTETPITVSTSSDETAETLDSPSGGSIGDDLDDGEPEKPVVVPDLLPPCTSAKGDATIAFFRACQGLDDAGTPVVRSAAASADNHNVPPTPDVAKMPNKPTSAQTKSATTTASTMFSTMFSTVRKSSTAAGTGGSSITGGIMGSFTGTSATSITSTLTGGMMTGKGFSVFRKSQKGDKSRLPASDRGSSETSPDSSEDSHAGEYTVQIEREMLGLTVENVLERTVVRTVLAGGPAKKAGAKVGSLIVKVGSVETKNLTHFETIDELRQSQRPLQLVLRLISDDALRSAREEMGRLIRGSGFGVITGAGSEILGDASSENKNPALAYDQQQGKPLIASDLRVDAYSGVVRRRFNAVAETKNKKEETLERASEKLVWILTLFVNGLERQAERLLSLSNQSEHLEEDSSDIDFSSSPRRRSSSSTGGIYHHTAKDYADAAKIVSKILHDFVKKNLDSTSVAARSMSASGFTLDNCIRGRGRKGTMQAPAAPGVRIQPVVPGMQSGQDSTILHDKPLLQIGDVLHRVRSFLADPTSPPAALLRGELIAFLCDVLDIDTEMELSEEEAVTSTAGGKAGPITDLGSAGLLLKLIILNCSIMRSPGCESVSSQGGKIEDELAKELKRRFGGKTNLDGADLHRLHAGNRFLSVVHRLAASRSTSARITACSLGPVLWGHLDFPHQLQLRGVITRALHDAEAIVRKSTATVLHEIAELVFDPRAVPWLVLMCERAMTDPEPQLRSAAMTLTWHLAEHLPNAFLGDASQGSRFLRRLPNRSDPVFADVYLLQCKLLPVATRLAEDRAPLVRLAVAAQCDRLCSSLGDHWSSVIIDVLLALLQDSDERVRSEAVLCVPRLAEIVLMSTSGSSNITDVSVLDALLPASLVLQKDKNSSVRVSLATAAGELLTLLVGLQSIEEISALGGSESTSAGQLKKHVDNVLIPLVQRLLQDSDPEVTSSALRAVTNASRGTVREIRPRHMSMASEDDASVSSHVSDASKQRKEPVFLPVLSEDQVLRLLPTLSELGNSRQWRVRQSAVEIVPALLGCTRNKVTRAEIARLCTRLMSDKVDAVRRTAAECLCMGGGSLGSHGENVGSEWITTIVIPHIRACAISSNTKQRLLSLRMIESILLNGACPTKWKGDEEGERLADSPMRELAVIALSLANDNVPNVRLNVGRVLESCIHVFEEDALSFIREVLMQQLSSERDRPGGGDRDVIFFATRCIRKALALLDDENLTQTDELIHL